MTVPVALFLALAVSVFAYSQGQGGPVAGLIFFGIVLLGAIIHMGRPLLEKAKS